MEEKKDQKISRRIVWTVIILTLFALFSFFGGMLHKKLGNDFSFENIDKAAKDIID